MEGVLFERPNPLGGVTDYEQPKQEDFQGCDLSQELAQMEAELIQAAVAA